MINGIPSILYMFSVSIAEELSTRWGELVNTDYSGEPIGLDKDKVVEIILECFKD